MLARPIPCRSVLWESGSVEPLPSSRTTRCRYCPSCFAEIERHPGPRCGSIPSRVVPAPATFENAQWPGKPRPVTKRREHPEQRGNQETHRTRRAVPGRPVLKRAFSGLFPEVLDGERPLELRERLPDWWRRSRGKPEHEDRHFEADFVVQWERKRRATPQRAGTTAIVPRKMLRNEPPRATKREPKRAAALRVAPKMP